MIRVAPRTAQDVSDLVSPEDQNHPVQDDSLVRQPDSSTEESDTEERASESHISNNSDTPAPRYRIPDEKKKRRTMSSPSFYKSFIHGLVKHGISKAGNTEAYSSTTDMDEIAGLGCFTGTYIQVLGRL